MSDNVIYGVDFVAAQFAKVEGPAYADRIGGKLTFRDWDSWSPEDQVTYAEQRAARLSDSGDCA